MSHPVRKFSFKNYFVLLFHSIFHPLKFFREVQLIKSFRGSLLFFIFNTVISSTVIVILKIENFKQNNVPAFIAIESFLLIALFITFFWITGLTLHLLAKLFKARESLVSGYKALAYSSTPLLFLFIPNIKLLLFLWLAFLLTNNYKNFYKLTLPQTLVFILVPFLVVVFLLLLLGILSFSQLGF